VNPTTLMSAGLVAPPTAAFALITFTAKSTTLANADVFKVGGVSLTLGSVQTEPNET
jgi:hypothetical protein